MDEMTRESVTLMIEAVSLFVALAAVWIARSSLSQAQRVADRDQRDWRQRKWFDLYFKADEAYDALDRFQTLYSSWNPEELEREWNDLMTIMRGVHRMALVFPQTTATAALLSSTAVFKNPQQAASKDCLSKLFDAVEGIRQKALLDTSVL
jgi:hypothetical protein